jgi:lysophospholipase L1-like esterase
VGYRRAMRSVSLPVSLRYLVVALLALMAGCGSDDRNVTDEETDITIVPATVRYTALGDSLATGAGADTSYVAEYADWLEAETGSAVEVTDLAVNGWTSQDLLRALNRDASMRAAVAEAHVVTWSIGGNDLLAALPSFLQGTCGGSDGQDCIHEAVEVAAENGEAVLDELLALRDGRSDGLLTLGLYLPFMDAPHVAPFLDGLWTHLDAFNRDLTQTAQERGVPVADVAGAFHGPEGDEDPVTRGLISEDGLHPSDRGHEVIAEELAAAGLQLGDPTETSAARLPA